MNASSGRLISGIKLLVVLMLTVVTIVLPNMIDRYEVAGDELLVNNGFDKKFDNWQKAGDVITVSNDSQLVVQLKSDNNQKVVSIRQTLKNVQQGQPVRLVSAMKTQNVGKGDKVWQAARIIFVALDNDGRAMYNVPHILVTRNGTTDWEYFSKVFVALSHAAGYYVEIQLVKVKGVVLVKELSLLPVKETLAFSLYWIIGALLWIVVTLWILVPYRRTLFASKWNVLITLMVTVALIGALLPVDLKHTFVESAKLLFPWVDEEAVFFRIGHFLVYSLLSVAVFWKIQSGHQVIVRSGLLIVFAMATEIMQFLVDGRTPRVSDIFVDVSGIAMGLFIFRMLSSYNKMCLKQGVG